MHIETKKQVILGRGRYLELVDEQGWEYVRRVTVTGVVVIVATTDEGALVLVEQPRTAVHRQTIELPAGLVGDLAGTSHETLETAAARELEEEAGFQASTWRRLTAGPTAVGMSTEIVTLFRATGLVRVGPGGGDDTEDITVHVVPLPGVPAFLEEKARDGALIDPKIFAGLYFVHVEGRDGDPIETPR